MTVPSYKIQPYVYWRDGRFEKIMYLRQFNVGCLFNFWNDATFYAALKDVATYHVSKDFPYSILSMVGMPCIPNIQMLSFYIKDTDNSVILDMNALPPDFSTIPEPDPEKWMTLSFQFHMSQEQRILLEPICDAFDRHILTSIEGPVNLSVTRTFM